MGAWNLPEPAGFCGIHVIRRLVSGTNIAGDGFEVTRKESTTKDAVFINSIFLIIFRYCFPIQYGIDVVETDTI